MRGDVTRVTVSIGDTIVTCGLATGPFAFDWAPQTVLVPHTGDTPLRTRIGLADVMLERVAPPERTLPYAPATEWRAWRFLALSLVLHLVTWGIATTQAPVPVRTVKVSPPPPEHRVRLSYSAHDEAAGDDLGATGGGYVAMRLDTPRAPAIVDEVGDIGTTTSTADLLAALTSDKVYSSSGDADESFGPLYGPGAESVSGFGTVRTSFTADGGTVPTRQYEPVKTGADYSGVGVLRGRSGGFHCTLSFPEAISMDGEIDKEVIRRYIQRKVEQLTYCYESQLLSRKDLAGEVSLGFTIDAGGSVNDVVASGISPEVETCIARVIGTIEFPQSRGGGTTRVNYPLTFRVAR